MRLTRQIWLVMIVCMGYFSTQLLASETNVNFSQLESVFIKSEKYSQWIGEHGFDDPELKEPTETNETEVLIVGGGPGGLFTALLAYEAGSKVVLLEKRPEYKREQIVNIFDRHLVTLAGYYPENDHLTNIIDKAMGHVTWVKLKNLEWMVYSILEKIAAKDPDRFKILHRHELVGTTAEGRKAVIRIGNTNHKLILNPDYIVGADSYNSFVRDHFEFDEEYSHDKGLYITVVFNKPSTYYDDIRMGDNYKLVGDDSSFNFSAKLSERGSREYWDLKKSNAPAYVFQQFAAKYAKTHIVASQGTKIALQNFPGHANVFHVFEKKSKKQLKAIEESAKNLKVFLVGDAYRTVVYYDTGMGANNAIADAYEFEKELKYRQLVSKLPIYLPKPVWNGLLTTLYPDIDFQAPTSGDVVFDDDLD